MSRSLSSLCNLCVLCVSVVVIAENWLTTETQRTQRLHREIKQWILPHEEVGVGIFPRRVTQITNKFSIFAWHKRCACRGD